MFAWQRHVTTLGLALGAHAAAVAATRWAPIRMQAVGAALAPETTVIVVDVAPAAAPSAEQVTPEWPQRAGSAAAIRLAARAPSRNVEGDAPTKSAAPATAAEPTSTEPWSVWSGIVRASPVAGDSHFEPPGSAAPERPTAVDGVRAALDERDRQLGLGADGPLISVIQSVTLSSRVAIESSAVVFVTVDGDGSVVSARATSGTGDASAWNDVVASVLQAMRGKKLRVPHGARGLRLSLRVESRRRQVAGHAVGSGQRSPVLVTHDDPHAPRAPSIALGTPVYRCLEACTASGNIDPTDGALLATTRAARSVVVRSLGQERIP